MHLFSRNNLILGDNPIQLVRFIRDVRWVLILNEETF